MRSYLAERGIVAEVIRLDGAVETAVALGVADVIADVVETGTTLRHAGLEVFGDPILRSEAVLIRPRNADADPAVEQLVRRLQGVIIARRYVLMDYDVRDELVEKAVGITPGHRVADRVAAAHAGLVGGAGHGAGLGDESHHGSAVGPRRARHPGYEHPRVPALIRRLSARAATWTP